MRLLRSHGMTTLTWDRHRGHASGYDVVDLGFNYRIDEPRAALARRRLERLDADNARRASPRRPLSRAARGRRRADPRTGARAGRAARAPPVHRGARRGRSIAPASARRSPTGVSRPACTTRPHIASRSTQGRRPARLRCLRRPRGHAAHVRHDDQRAAGRGRRRHPCGARRSPRWRDEAPDASARAGHGQAPHHRRGAGGGPAPDTDDAAPGHAGHLRGAPCRRSTRSSCSACTGCGTPATTSGAARRWSSTRSIRPTPPTRPGRCPTRR